LKTTYFRRQILDLPVYKKNKDKELARVRDVLLDLARGESPGLAIEAVGVWKNIKFLPWENVVDFTEEQVIADFAKPLRSLGKRRAQLLAEHWIGRRLWQESDILCGTVADIALESKGKGDPTASYIISGIAMSGGVWQDIYQGWTYIPWAQVAPVALAEMKHQKQSENRKNNKNE